MSISSEGKIWLEPKHYYYFSLNKMQSLGIPENGSGTSSSRQCWICFATDEDEDAPNPPLWTQPCKCKGTTKWAHQSCLLMWVDMKLKSTKEAGICCPQCKTLYRIFYPDTNTIASILTRLDSTVYVSSPFIAGIVTVSLIYWSAFTYGTIVFVQVVGMEKALETLDNLRSSGVLFISLPTIPVLLLLFNMVRWEDRVLELLRKIGRHSPSPLKYILPVTVDNSEIRSRSIGVNEGMTCTRICAGAFLLPTIAVLTGKLLFEKRIESPVTRALMGGMVYTLLSGIFTMYHKQQTYRRIGGMRILDYNPPPQESPSTVPASFIH